MTYDRRCAKPRNKRPWVLGERAKFGGWGEGGRLAAGVAHYQAPASRLLYPFPLAADTSRAWFLTEKAGEVTTLHTLGAQVIVRVIGIEILGSIRKRGACARRERINGSRINSRYVRMPRREHGTSAHLFLLPAHRRVTGPTQTLNRSRRVRP